MFKKIFRILKWVLGAAGVAGTGYYLAKKYKPRAKTIRVLMNPLSGKGMAKEAVSEIKEAFAKYMPDVKLEILFSRSQGDLAALARKSVEEKCEVVCAAGGDGAVNEVVQGLAGSLVALGIIPLGTGNAFAQEMNIPHNIDGAVDVLASGKVHRVDLGKVGERYFLWLAGIGADALVAQELTPEMKDTLGVFSYFVFAMKHVKKIPFFDVKIISGGREIKSRALCVIAGNATSYDGKLQIKSTDSLDDGYLDVCVAEKVTTLGILRQILFFMAGRREYYRDIEYFGVKYFKAKRIRVETTPAVYVHTDGEVVGQTPVECVIIPKMLSVILPSA